MLSTYNKKNLYTFEIISMESLKLSKSFENKCMKNNNISALQLTSNNF